MAPSRPDRNLDAFRRRLTVAAAGVAACFALGAMADPAPVAAGDAPVAAAPAAKAAPSGGKSVPAVATGLRPGNSQQPINLEAASSDFDYKNNSLLFKRVKITQGDLEVTAQQASATGLEFENSEWRLQGDVRITVPGGSLQSTEARVQFRKNEIVSASIKGAPAAFEQRLKQNDQVARGKADSINYDVKESIVRLVGDAWLTDGQNEIRGNTLVYDIGRERVQANPNEKDPGGVRITINPPKKAAEAAPAPDTAQ